MAEKLIIGCGYLGRRVAARWVDDGKVVHAVTRSKNRADEFITSGIRPVIADVTDTDTLQALGELSNVDTVLFAVGFDRSVGHPIHKVYVDGLRSVLAALPASIQRFIYISSTGVYGQTDGGWIDESSPCEPTREGGKACLEAEQLLQKSRFGNRAIILRLAGIYGRDRVPRKADLLNRKSFPTEGHLNLIHVEDAADTVIAAENRAALPSLYVVSDGTPVLRADYYAELRRLLGVVEEKENDSDKESADAIETSSRKQRARADKRIRSDRYRLDLQFAPQFQSYREGLAAILGAG